MIKKTITYTDFFEETEVTEDFYFNLSKAELMELEASFPGGMQKYFNKIIKEENGAEVMNVFKNILLKSYGKRDGGKFVKSEAIRDEFYSSPAYSELLMELLSSETAATEFFKRVLPAGTVQ